MIRCFPVTIGEALNVNITNAGVSFDLDVSAVLGVTNAGENPLYVQGYTGSNGVPLTVR